MTVDLPRVKVRLSVLRETGWQLWDPIGIAEYRNQCENEYDSYLLHVAALLIEGRPKEEGVAYLVDVASNHMGGPPYRIEAERTVDALSDYITELQSEVL